MTLFPYRNTILISERHVNIITPFPYYNPILISERHVNIRTRYERYKIKLILYNTMMTL